MEPLTDDPVPWHAADEFTLVRACIEKALACQAKIRSCLLHLKSMGPDALGRPKLHWKIEKELCSLSETWDFIHPNIARHFTKAGRRLGDFPGLALAVDINWMQPLILECDPGLQYHIVPFKTRLEMTCATARVMSLATDDTVVKTHASSPRDGGTQSRPHSDGQSKTETGDKRKRTEFQQDELDELSDIDDLDIPLPPQGHRTRPRQADSSYTRHADDVQMVPDSRGYNLRPRKGSSVNTPAMPRQMSNRVRTGILPHEMKVLWTRYVQSRVEASIGPVIRHLSVPSNVKKSNDAIESGKSWSQDARVSCCPCSSNQIKMYSIKRLLTMKLRTAMPVLHRESGYSTSFHKVIAGSHLPPEEIDVSDEASHQCHLNACIIPQHINLLPHKDNMNLMRCQKYALFLREQGVLIPLQCTEPGHNPPCRLACAAGHPREHVLGQWLRYHDYSSLDDVPLDQLLPILEPSNDGHNNDDELLDFKLRACRVVMVNGVEMLQPRHEITLRTYIQARIVSEPQTAQNHTPDVDTGDRARASTADLISPIRSRDELDRVCHELRAITFREIHDEDSIDSRDARKGEMQGLVWFVESDDGKDKYRQSNRTGGWTHGGVICMLCASEIHRCLDTSQRSPWRWRKNGYWEAGTLLHILHHLGEPHHQHESVRAFCLLDMINKIKWLRYDLIRSGTLPTFNRLCAMLEKSEYPNTDMIANFRKG